MQKPQLYDYSNPFLFIKDTFKYFKSINPSQTVRGWSLEMELKSPKVIIEILNMKRPIKLKYIDFLMKGLRIDASEKTYFQVLVLSSQAISAEEKEVFEKMRLQLSLQKNNTITRPENPDLFSKWHHALVLTLANVKGVSLSPNEIQSLSRYKVSEDELNETIQILEQMGLLKNSEGQFVKSHSFVSTKTDVPHRGGQMYVEQVSELAKASVNVNPTLRELQCFSLAIKKSELSKIKELIRNFRLELMKMTDSEADFVYQVNLQFFPLTKELRQPGKEALGLQAN